MASISVYRWIDPNTIQATTTTTSLGIVGNQAAATTGTRYLPVFRTNEHQQCPSASVRRVDLVHMRIARKPLFSLLVPVSRDLSTSATTAAHHVQRCSQLSRQAGQRQLRAVVRRKALVTRTRGCASQPRRNDFSSTANSQPKRGNDAHEHPLGPDCCCLYSHHTSSRAPLVPVWTSIPHTSVTKTSPHLDDPRIQPLLRAVHHTNRGRKRTRYGSSGQASGSKMMVSFESS